MRMIAVAALCGSAAQCWPQLRLLWWQPAAPPSLGRRVRRRTSHTSAPSRTPANRANRANRHRTARVAQPTHVCASRQEGQGQGAETKQHFALGCGRRPPALHWPEGSACSPRQCRTPARATLPALRFALHCIALCGAQPFTVLPASVFAACGVVYVARRRCMAAQPHRSARMPHGTRCTAHPPVRRPLALPYCGLPGAQRCTAGLRSSRTVAPSRCVSTALPLPLLCFALLCFALLWL
jgi:hypothetical protein